MSMLRDVICLSTRFVDFRFGTKFYQRIIYSSLCSSCMFFILSLVISVDSNYNILVVVFLTESSSLKGREEPMQR